jgi:hypothetical protein
MTQVWAGRWTEGKKRVRLKKRPGPGGGLGTGARMDKRREDSEAVHGVVTRGQGRGRSKEVWTPSLLLLRYWGCC